MFVFSSEEKWQQCSQERLKLSNAVIITLMILSMKMVISIWNDDDAEDDRIDKDENYYDAHSCIVVTGGQIGDNYRHARTHARIRHTLELKSCRGNEELEKSS